MSARDIDVSIRSSGRNVLRERSLRIARNRDAVEIDEMNRLEPPAGVAHSSAVAESDVPLTIRSSCGCPAGTWSAAGVSEPLRASLTSDAIPLQPVGRATRRRPPSGRSAATAAD